jgi:hypothetical protein
LRRTGRHSRYDFSISKLSHFWFDCIGCDQLPEKIILLCFKMSGFSLVKPKTEYNLDRALCNGRYNNDHWVSMMSHKFIHGIVVLMVTGLRVHPRTNVRFTYNGRQFQFQIQLNSAQQE